MIPLFSPVDAFIVSYKEVRCNGMTKDTFNFTPVGDGIRCRDDWMNLPIIKINVLLGEPLTT